MKKLLLICLVLFGCKEAEQPKQKLVTTIKVVKGKNQSEETSYKYKYNLWKGNFYHQPDIHSVYYIVFTDGSYKQVDVGKYTITNIGDTIKESTYVNQ